MSSHTVMLYRRPHLFLAIFLCLTASSGRAQNYHANANDSIVGEPWTGTNASRESTAQIMQRAKLADAQPASPRRFIKRNIKPGKRDETIEFPISVSTNGVAFSQSGPPLTAQPGPFGTNGTPLAFTGATLSETGSYPPDTMGAVGPAQFIVAVNGRIRSFNKTTGLADGVLNSSMDSFFNSVKTPVSGSIIGNFTSDPRIRYDRLSKRWIVLIIDVPYTSGSPFTTAPNRVLIAVSDSSIVTAGTGWSFYYFQQDQVSTIGDTGDFADYPTLGVDTNALYIGANMFSSAGSFVNTTAFVVRKSSILSGGPIVVTAFRNLISGSGAGPYTPQGVDNYDPTATEGYIIGVDSVNATRLRLRRISNPGGTPTISANVSLTVATFAAPLTVPNKGGANNLDGLDDRLLAAHYRNGFLWTAQNVSVNSTGTTTGADRNGVRWYQIKGVPTGSTLALQSSGTLYDSTITNRFYWMGTIMVSGQGHTLLGFSCSGSNEYVNAGMAGQLTNGTMGSPILYTASTTAYNPPYDRWGDYSYTSLDPNDDMTMWTIQEYCNAANSYAVQIAKVLAPPPVTPTNCSPAAVNQGVATTNLTLTGSSLNGSGFFDPGAGFSNRLTAAISGTGVTINSVTYNNPTNITFNLTTATNATTGLHVIVITNPDGQSVTNSLLTINGNLTPNNPPTLTAIANRTNAELTTLQFTNTASDPDDNTLTFSMLNAPTNATLTPNTGVFTWTPTEAQGPMTTNISIIVTDNGAPSLSTTQSFTVTVLETNSAPALAAISNRTLVELSTLMFTNAATDADLPTNTLAFALLNAPTNATLNAATGVFTWTPTEAQGPMTTNISIVVTDNGSPSLSTTQTFTITVLETNSAPTLAAISNRTLVELSTLTFTNSATDADLPTNTLTFSLLNAPTNATLDPATGVFAWTPDETQGPSSNHISVIVTDDGSPSLSTTQSFTVIVLETNSAPSLMIVSNYTITELTTLTFTNVAIDGDLPANPLTFSLLDAPTNATLDPATGVFTWTPTEAQGPSSNYLSVVVADNGSPSLNATQSFTVVVLETNSEPSLAPVADRIILANETLTFTNAASDTDLPANLLAFSLDANAPTNATINPTNGVFAWTPDVAQAPSTNQISVIVADDGTPSLSATQTFTVVVLESNTPPVLAALSNRVLHAGTTLRVQAAATSGLFATNQLVYSLDAGTPATAAINPTNGLLIWPTTDTDAGTTNDFSVRVTDAGTPPLAATQTFSVAVAPRLSIRSVDMGNSNDTVTWNAITGLTYQLQLKDNFEDSNWLNATNAVTADSPTVSQTVPASNARRYYRVIVP